MLMGGGGLKYLVIEICGEEVKPPLKKLITNSHFWYFELVIICMVICTLHIICNLSDDPAWFGLICCLQEAVCLVEGTGEDK